jgi:HK97 family phage prohead protease
MNGIALDQLDTSTGESILRSSSRREKDEPQDDGLIHRSFGLGLDIKSLDKTTRSVDFVFSDESIDSFEEVVDQSWDLTRYVKNPVLLYDHNKNARWAEDPRHSLPIGHSENVRVENSALRGRIFLVSEAANPLAEMCWRCMLEGALRAGSVGFKPRDVVEEMRDGREILRLKNNTLYEFSLTPIGANENAIANSAHSDRERAYLKSLVRKAVQIQVPGPQSGGERESSMDIKAMEAELSRLKSELEAILQRATTAEASSKAALAAKESLEASFNTLKDANLKLEKENLELNAQLVGSEVSALVGKKISPAQVEKFVKLRVEWGKAEFDEFIKSMPDLPYTTEVTENGGQSAINTATGRKSAGASKLVAAAVAVAQKASGSEDIDVEG